MEEAQKDQNIMTNSQETGSAFSSNIGLEPATSFQALRQEPKKQAEILGQYTPEEQQTILYRQRVLSSLAYFIGKDFTMPVKLNEPGGGWHWDFQANETFIDPKDLLEKPMNYLRFVISHEGGHRRISRAADIPLEVWTQPGFSFMMNAIEDPRDNNFVAEAYPKFADDMDVAYQLDMDFEKKAKTDAKGELGFQPRFMQAGFEYIKQWFAETRGEEPVLSDDLPDDVKDIVQKTIESARDSWLRYPSRPEADRGESMIRRYAQVSYEINRDEVWPEFKKLVEEDMKDERMQELLKQMAQDGQGEGEQGMGQGLQDNLTQQEQQELSDAIQNAMQASEGNEGQPGKMVAIDLDSLSPSLKQKIQDYIDSLPEDVRKELEQKSKEAIEAYEQKLNEELEGKLSDTPTKKRERQTQESQQVNQDASDQKPQEREQERTREEPDDLREFRDLIDQAVNRDENIYEATRREVLPIIDALENDLREIFVARRAHNWESGYRTGKRIDIKKRIQEKAKGISAVESHAWQRRELPQEKDYAITLLVDLSGSMQGQKIRETFKGAVVLAEVLNRLSIQTEVLGFNDKLYEYQDYGQDMNREVREVMGGMLREVSSSGARYNDDGWAVEQASERLARQKAKEKFLFVLSDGEPVPSSAHSARRYELSGVIERVMKDTDQKLIGLGIGSGTGHVEDYYPNSVANISVRQMPDKLADVIREAIANFDAF